MTSRRLHGPNPRRRAKLRIATITQCRHDDAFVGQHAIPERVLVRPNRRAPQIEERDLILLCVAGNPVKGLFDAREELVASPCSCASNQSRACCKSAQRGSKGERTASPRRRGQRATSFENWRARLPRSRSLGVLVERLKAPASSASTSGVTGSGWSLSGRVGTGCGLLMGSKLTPGPRTDATMSMF